MRSSFVGAAVVFVLSSTQAQLHTGGVAEQRVGYDLVINGGRVMDSRASSGPRPVSD